MARWIEGARPGEGYWTNTSLAACELCGVDLGPGEAELRRCRGRDNPDHNVPDPMRHDEPRGGVHARCRDEGACRRRRTPKAVSKRKRARAISQPQGPAQDPTRAAIPTATAACEAPPRRTGLSDQQSASPQLAPAPSITTERRTHV